MMTNEIEIIENAFKKHESLMERGWKERLTIEENSQILSTLLFDLTKVLGQRLVEVRSYEEIAEKGVFRYAGLADTMHKEGFMPDDVYESLKELGIDRHVGPCYLKVKGLLTFALPREFFGKQCALKIDDYLTEKGITDPDRYIICIPNMTGGAWIGDQTRRELDIISAEREYKVWPATPYARSMRKIIEVSKGEEKFKDFVEGPIPPPEKTSAILGFEELRTAAETTTNALNIYERFGYSKENNVSLIAASVFDYRHQAGVGRLEKLEVDGIYQVSGEAFFNASKNLGYISGSQHEAASDWLKDHWEFTRNIMSDIRKVVK